MEIKQTTEIQQQVSLHSVYTLLNTRTRTPFVESKATVRGTHYCVVRARKGLSYVDVIQFVSHVLELLRLD